MREVVPGVYIMEGLLVGNVYLLQSDRGATLIDSGTPVDVDASLLKCLGEEMTQPTYTAL
jgi:glyoxylase-like metal-dependent hydrolase (beta-lactamase superfamily II)